MNKTIVYLNLLPRPPVDYEIACAAELTRGSAQIMENFEDNLAEGERLLKANLQQLRSVTAKPTDPEIAAVTAVESIIVTATKQQAGLARLCVIALRELGKFLLRTPYLKGRPPKVSTVDTLPSLKKLGIKDRRIAWRAIQVARVDEEVSSGI